MSESVSLQREGYVNQMKQVEQQLNQLKAQADQLSTQREQLKGAVFALDSLMQAEAQSKVESETKKPDDTKESEGE